MLLEISGFSFDTQVFQCITCCIFHSMVYLLISWVFTISLEGKMWFHRRIFLTLIIFEKFFLFFVMYWIVIVQGSVTVSSTSEGNLRVDDNQANPAHSIGWENHGWFYISVRIGFFLWVRKSFRYFQKQLKFEICY